MKKLLLLCLLPVFAFAEPQTMCFKMDYFDEFSACYGDVISKLKNESQRRKVTNEYAERLQRWHYKKTKDEMRNRQTTFAVVNNTEYYLNNERGVTLSVGGSAHRQEVYFLLSKGFFDCTYNACSAIAVKIDDEGIFHLPVAVERKRGNALSIINIKSKTDFINKLKSGKRMIIELPIYNMGKQQVQFNIEGLKWEYF